MGGAHYQGVEHFMGGAHYLYGKWPNFLIISSVRILTQL